MPDILDPTLMELSADTAPLSLIRQVSDIDGESQARRGSRCRCQLRSAFDTGSPTAAVSAALPTTETEAALVVRADSCAVMTTRLHHSCMALVPAHTWCMCNARRIWSATNGTTWHYLAHLLRAPPSQRPLLLPSTPKVIPMVWREATYSM